MTYVDDEQSHIGYKNRNVNTLINPIVKCLFDSLWWPCFVILFYVLSVIPTLCIKRWMQTAMFGPSYFDLSIFLTMGFVVSSFGLPIVLARAGVVCIKLVRAADKLQCFSVFHFACKFQIKITASILTILGNVVVYLTIFGYFVFLDPDETSYGGMA